MELLEIVAISVPIGAIVGYLVCVMAPAMDRILDRRIHRRAVLSAAVAKECLAEEAAPAQPTKSVEWRIRLDGERFFFRRYVDGHCDESYRSVFAPEAAVWAAAIIQRFQPPRSLLESDIPVG